MKYPFSIFVAAAVGVGLAWLITTGVTLTYRSLTSTLALSYQSSKTKILASPLVSPPIKITKSVAPAISARAYFLADLETGKVFGRRGSEASYSIASLTKLMTALVAVENINQTNLVEVGAAALAAGSDAGGLILGEKLPAADLLYPLLLESSNDAAEAMARDYGRERFISLMNKKAKALGLNRTFFADPSGMAEENRSTAHDLFHLADYLYHQAPSLLALTKIPQKRSGRHLWLNNNRLAGAVGYLGGKTGQTSAARETLVALFDVPLGDGSHRSVGLVLLQSDNREADARALLGYLQNEFVSKL